METMLETDCRPGAHILSATWLSFFHEPDLGIWTLGRSMAELGSALSGL